jgi:hypothetical protein
VRTFGAPVLDLFGPKPFVDHQQMFDPSFLRGRYYYVRSCDVAALEDAVIDTVVEHGARITSPVSSIALWQMGGAVSRSAMTTRRSTAVAQASLQHQRQQPHRGRM